MIAQYSKEDFASLLDQTLDQRFEGNVLQGTVVDLTKEYAIIDVGLKSEGRVALEEFALPGVKPEIHIGDTIDVFVERYESKDGSIILSRAKARREESWVHLQKAFEEGTPVEGVVTGRVKGGFTVDVGGAQAFLPGSQVDIRPTRDISGLSGSPQSFLILKMDRIRGNMVVSRRAILEKARADQRNELVHTLKEGMVVEGIVKNLTEYGAFVDLGGVDGLLHVTDISWRRIQQPSDVLSIGQTIQVQVTRFNQESGRISLGLKQMEPDPWEDADKKYPIGTKIVGNVSSITDYGAFVDVAPGVEGLIHASEMSWTEKNIIPSQHLSLDQRVEVIVLDIDKTARRLSLGLKQTHPNPWQTFQEKHPVGNVVQGIVRNIDANGLTVGLGMLEGKVQTGDVSWENDGSNALSQWQIGQTLEAQVLGVEVAEERIHLGIKQLTKDPIGAAWNQLSTGQTVQAIVRSVQQNGIEVSINGLPGFVRRGELARDKMDQKPERFHVDQEIQVKISSLDRNARRMTLTIKALEQEEERNLMEKHAKSTSNGASFGDILAAAIRRRAGISEK